ncbi:MAG: 50S ribosome-binding GTPase [Mycoplasmataceae bacterium]|jgi:ribosome biogenesis GTPase A|nr:50S ribosome-binding GTPase [Mycoplasmataceae bacterium]
MAKALNNILSTKKVDLVIQVLDARAIEISSNKELIKNFNKPTINIAMKSDLSIAKRDENIIYVSKLDNNVKRIVITAMNNLMKEKIVHLKEKGLLKPHFHCMIIGLPNLGKSTLINLLLGRNKTEVSNKPGVTRHNSLIKINDTFSIYDTPGIMSKNVNDIKEGYILSLINCVPQKIVPMEDVLEFAFEYYKKYFFNDMHKIFAINKDTTFDNFVETVSIKNNFLTNNAEIDILRCHNYLYEKFVNSSLFKVNYEMINK